MGTGFWIIVGGIYIILIIEYFHICNISKKYNDLLDNLTHTKENKWSDISHNHHIIYEIANRYYYGDKIDIHYCYEEAIIKLYERIKKLEKHPFTEDYEEGIRQKIKQLEKYFYNLFKVVHHYS